MKYVGIDIESSCLNPKKGQVFSVGVVLDDLEDPKPIFELPRKHIIIDITEESHIHGSLKALLINKALLERIDLLASMKKEMSEKDFAAHLGPNEEFVGKHRVGPMIKEWIIKEWGLEKPKAGDPLKVTVSGKNVKGFDIPFLENFCDFGIDIRCRHRALDPTSHFWKLGDSELPSLQTCLERAGLSGTVSHNAVEDAMDVVRLNRVALLGQDPETLPPF